MHMRLQCYYNIQANIYAFRAAPTKLCTQIFHIGQSKMSPQSRNISRREWSHESNGLGNVRAYRPPLNHEGTYADKLTNVENVLARLHKASLNNIMLIVTL